jgi:hypothetical protein
MLKHWFLTVLMVFGLLAVGLYASPPDPGGTVVSSTVTNSINPDFLAGGAIERTSATIQSPIHSLVTVLLLGLASVIGAGLIGLLFSLTLSPLLTGEDSSNPRPYFNPELVPPVPDRYDKAIYDSTEVLRDRLVKRTKSPVLKRQSS